MLICAGLGFASGLPLFLLIQLVPAWLRLEGVSLTASGVISPDGRFATLSLLPAFSFLDEGGWRDAAGDTRQAPRGHPPRETHQDRESFLLLDHRGRDFAAHRRLDNLVDVRDIDLVPGDGFAGR